MKILRPLFIYIALNAVVCITAMTSTYAKGASPEVSQKCLAISAPYQKARAAYELKARKYWNQVKFKKSKRRSKRKDKQQIVLADYVLTFPPSYKGPSKPKCLRKKSVGGKRRAPIGRVKDYLRAAKRIYNFVPKRVSEQSYKFTYASEALSLGLTEEQVVGVYALETGGLGPHDRQSGIFNVTQDCKPRAPKGRPASTALGYAQLLAANTSAVVNENGEAFTKALEFSAVLSKGDRKKELLHKAAILRRMIKDIRSGIRKYKKRNNWREYVAFGKTQRGFAIHTLNLDADIGPKIQVKKLKKIITVASRKGHKSISAAQLELMNLVGYGRGLEMMRKEGRQAPTSNFFSRGGYERNPVAKNLTANGLLKKLAFIIKKKRSKCGSVEFTKAFQKAGRK